MIHLWQIRVCLTNLLLDGSGSNSILFDFLLLDGKLGSKKDKIVYFIFPQLFICHVATEFRLLVC